MAKKRLNSQAKVSEDKAVEILCELVLEKDVLTLRYKHPLTKEVCKKQIENDIADKNNQIAIYGFSLYQTKEVNEIEAKMKSDTRFGYFKALENN